MPKNEMPPGALVLLILRVLRSGPLHGYAIAQRIHTLSYQTSVQLASFYEACLERVKAIPDVEGVATTTMMPVEEQARHNPFSIEARTWQPTGNDNVPPFANAQAVSSGYFRALQIPLKLGRLLTDQDRDGTPPVAVVNETMVRGFWPDEDPIGKHIIIGGGPKPGFPWLTIVGVVGDVRSSGANAGVVPELYTPLLQTPSALTALVLRTQTADPEKTVHQLRSELAAIDRGVALYAVETYDDIFAHTWPATLRNAAAIELCHLSPAVGRDRHLWRHLLLRESALSGNGLAHGVRGDPRGPHQTGPSPSNPVVDCRYALGNRTWLYGLSFDLPAYAGGVFTMLAVSLLAAYLSARRAASLDPMTTLRAE